MRRPAIFRSESGQSIVEFAFVLPLLMGVVLGIIQFGILFHNYITITDAARVGARKAAVSRTLGDQGASARDAAIAAASNIDLKPNQVDVQATDWTTPGADVTVSVSYPYSLNILGWVVTSGNLTSSTHERLE